MGPGSLLHRQFGGMSPGWLVDHIIGRCAFGIKSILRLGPEIVLRAKSLSDQKERLFHAFKISPGYLSVYVFGCPKGCVCQVFEIFSVYFGCMSLVALYYGTCIDSPSVLVLSNQYE